MQAEEELRVTLLLIFENWLAWNMLPEQKGMLNISALWRRA
jgi:hypothetical protein